MFLGSDVAQHGGAAAGDLRGADGRRDVVVPRRHVGNQRPQRVEGVPTCCYPLGAEGVEATDGVASRAGRPVGAKRAVGLAVWRVRQGNLSDGHPDTRGFIVDIGQRMGLQQLGNKWLVLAAGRATTAVREGLVTLPVLA